MIGAGAAFSGFFIMLGLMMAGIPVAVSLFLVAGLGAGLYLGLPTLLIFGNQTWSMLNDFVLTAIPLFILLGEILLRSGITDRMYQALADWMGRWPGGLLHTNIAASGLFSSVSGSSVATAATIGTVALPALERHGYNRQLTLGTVAAGATLGILIPPSINMIIYGSMSNTSIGQLFVAGIVPGLLLMALFMGFIAIVCMIYPHWGGRVEEVAPLRERLARLADLLPPLFIFALVMGSIYFGWATPTESAALGVLGAFALALLRRRLSIVMLHEALLSTVRITSMILLIMIAASFLNFTIGIMGIPQTITRLVAEIGATQLQVLLLLVLFYLILGCFLETLSMMIATIPVVMPIVAFFGIDPVWFGVFLVILMEVSLITPPLGMNLYIVQGVRPKGGSIMDVIWGSLPFAMILLLLVGLLIAIPDLALWLPRLMFG
ncbi:TRAP transporter large permease [Telmatospirillum sp. J64-1]|uniref:TRAP transporter large permease n=1 Tax=Telmatospirillum sp. J64-1 TaxID=2502183 RepID=UPI00115D0CD9|nr:TRAP transporter large permease [Telmatospirillum sp. J64-1]